MIENRQTAGRRRQGEEGVILLMVVLLVALFSGLGLLAMRYTQGELRSANAYLDATQASAVAESAIMMVATDMRSNWRYPNESPCLNYYAGFTKAVQGGTVADIELGFSDRFNTDKDVCEKGKVPFANLKGEAPLAITGGPLSSSYADVTLSQDAPVIAPPPPGFSSDDESRTFDWYYFTVTSRAQYGYTWSGLSEAGEERVVRGQAVVRSHMKIGPVDSISGY